MRKLFILRTYLLAMTLLVAIAATGPATAGDDYFVDTDDFKEGEEVINVFLMEPEYRIMIESIERNGEEFDWGWVLTPGWGASSEEGASADEGKKRRKKRDKGPKTQQEPKVLGFNWADYRTVRIPEVPNHAGIMHDEELETIRDLMATVVENLGLEAQMSDSAGADLEFAAAVVDLSRSGGGFGFIQVEPSIELEMRIRDLGTGQDLVLLRHQGHAYDPTEAATEILSDLIQFLR